MVILYFNSNYLTYKSVLTTTIKDKKQFYMKMKHLSLLFLLFLLMSCEDSGQTIVDEPIPVQFSAYTITKEGGNAEGDVWERSDAVGIFMLKNQEQLSEASIVNEADNRKYLAKVIANRSDLVPASPQEVIYYERDTKVDFIAYDPHSTVLNNYIYAIDVYKQDQPKEIDLLYSNNAKGVEQSNSAVSLTFGHQLSKLNFKLVAGDGNPDISKAIITIDGLNTKADFDLRDGSYSKINSPNTIATYNNSALVIPQVSYGAKLTVTIDNNKFESTINTNEFYAGKIHSYKVTVNKTGISISVGNITEWIGKDDDAIEGGAEAEEYAVGDYYPDPKAMYENSILISGNPAIGIVYWIEPHSANKHGKIISIDQAYITWSAQFTETGAEHDSHGIYNMWTISKFNNWPSYPAFEWAHSKNKDTAIDYSNIYAVGIWYMPAIDELHAMYLAKIKYPQITTSIKNIGGDLFREAMYSSSTGYSSFNADAVDFKTGEVGMHGKRTPTYIRSVLAF